MSLPMLRAAGGHAGAESVNDFITFLTALGPSVRTATPPPRLDCCLALHVFQ